MFDLNRMGVQDSSVWLSIDWQTLRLNPVPPPDYELGCGSTKRSTNWLAANFSTRYLRHEDLTSRAATRRAEPGTVPYPRFIRATILPPVPTRQQGEMY